MTQQYMPRTHAAFDNERKLVAARQQLIMGIDLKAGDEIPADLDYGVRVRLWVTRWADYAEHFLPTPVDETATTAPGEQDPSLEQGDEWMAEADGVSVEKGSAGWYTITASWLPEPVKERGEEATKAKASELREAGPPPPPPADEAGDDTGE